MDIYFFFSSEISHFQVIKFYDVLVQQKKLQKIWKTLFGAEFPFILIFMILVVCNVFIEMIFNELWNFVLLLVLAFDVKNSVLVRKDLDFYYM